MSENEDTRPDNKDEESGIDQEDVRVARADACPQCDEDRQDWLVWIGDGTEVHCESCGTSYTPPVMKPI